uniref:FBA_2 domain-containing protein n=1 Tax=Syphacia muris TaxID=451379 RepID=A0A0N5ASD3_9BILA
MLSSHQMLNMLTRLWISVDCDVYIIDDGFQKRPFSEVIENQLPFVDLTDHYRFITEANNEKLRTSEFNVSKRRDEIVGEARKNDVFQPIPFDCKTTRQILSYFRIESLRITVNKRNAGVGQRDNKLVEVLHFLSTYCGGLHIRSLVLCSENAEKPWCLGLQSLRFLEQLRPLERLKICNIVELTDAALSAPETRSMELCFSSQKAFSKGLHILIPPAQSFGSMLDVFINSHIENQFFEFYVEKPNFLASISAEDIYLFIRKWQTLEPIWLFKKIAFNCRTAVHELRSCLPHIIIPQDQSTDREPQAIFRYGHISDKSHALDISYEHKQISTLWVFRVVDEASCDHVIQYPQ